jgi:hypothetical protein
VINPFIAVGQYASDIGMLEAELRAGLKRFWRAAATVLDGSTIQLVPPDQATFSLPRNFFSTLFLYSYHRVGIPAERRILYAAVNQCLRGMVTGCDNLLDDEYKITLETDLPAQAHRFRSVLDIMVADRVLFALLVAHCQAHDLPVDLALRASTASLQALTKSGAQEAQEEGGIEERLEPEVILRTIHHYKTGVLFQSTWVIPALFEEATRPEVLLVQEALYTIGIGCQLLDDIVDLMVDLREGRHNYVASVIAHREPPAVWQRLTALVAADQTADYFYAAFPEISTRMQTEALAMLESGLRALFADKHQGLVRPAAAFIADRIGVQTSRY